MPKNVDELDELESSLPDITIDDEDEDEIEGVGQENEEEGEEAPKKKKTEAEDGEPGDDDEDPKSKDEEEAYGPRVQKRIRKLTYKQREAERRAQEAERRAEEAERRIQELTGQYTESSKSVFEANSKALDAELNAVRREYAEAATLGDADKMFEASAKLAQVQAQKTALQYEQREFEKSQPKKREADEEEPKKRQQPQQRAVDNSKAEAWVRENTWFGKDKTMTRAAYGLDADLKEEGYDPADDEFYAEIDRRLREEFPHKFKASEPERKRTTQPVAGGSRTPAGAKQKKGKNDLPELTASEKRMAARLGVPENEYALQKKMRDR